MNNTFQQSFRCGCGRVRYSHGFTGELLHGGESFGKLALPREKPPFPPSLHTTWIAPSWNRGDFLFSQGEVPLRYNCQVCLQPDHCERLRCYGDRPIQYLASHLEIAQGHVTVSKVKQDACISGIKRSRFFQIRVRFSPLPLTSLNRPNREIGFGLVRQITFRDFKFAKSTLVIAIAIVIGKTECEMSFRKIRLQPECFIGIETRFFSTIRCW